jgi:hypothetical protein
LLITATSSRIDAMSSISANKLLPATSNSQTVHPSQSHYWQCLPADKNRAGLKPAPTFLILFCAPLRSLRLRSGHALQLNHLPFVYYNSSKFALAAQISRKLTSRIRILISPRRQERQVRTNFFLKNLASLRLCEKIPRFGCGYAALGSSWLTKST